MSFYIAPETASRIRRIATFSPELGAELRRFYLDPSWSRADYKFLDLATQLDNAHQCVSLPDAEPGTVRAQLRILAGRIQKFTWDLDPQRGKVLQRAFDAVAAMRVGTGAPR